MKFEIELEIEGEKSHWEEYTESVAENEVEAWARKTIDWFNGSLKPGEKPRKYIGFRVLGEDLKHDWVKSSLTTQSERGVQFDRMKCARCGITGKRMGLGRGTQMDSKYRKAAFKMCHTTTPKMVHSA